MPKCRKIGVISRQISPCSMSLRPLLCLPAFGVNDRGRKPQCSYHSSAVFSRLVQEKDDQAGHNQGDGQGPFRMPG